MAPLDAHGRPAVARARERPQPRDPRRLDPSKRGGAGPDEGLALCKYGGGTSFRAPLPPEAYARSVGRSVANIPRGFAAPRSTATSRARETAARPRRARCRANIASTFERRPRADTAGSRPGELLESAHEGSCSLLVANRADRANCCVAD